LPSTRAHRRLLLAGLICFAALACCLSRVLREPAGKAVEVAEARQQGEAKGRAEREKDKGKEQPKRGPTKAYYGVAACQNKGCHGGEPPKTWWKEEWVNPETHEPFDFPLLCRCDESDRWSKTDKHADAFNVLKGERGQRMAGILGYDVTKEKACLVCHSVYLDPEKDKDLLTRSKKTLFKVEEGVNCVVCHGAYIDWVSRHGILVTVREFRPLSREAKEKEYGMKNLWDPVKRTELCSSCHVGNWQEEKFITHEMYAAGHPPLPGFEVTAFSDEMPRHWEYLRDKKPVLQKELGLREGELEQGQLLLVGAVVTFRESMRLLRDQSKAASNSDGPDLGRAGLDLANFDCLVCHHDLNSPSAAALASKRRSGRLLAPWLTTLVRLALDYLAEDQRPEGAEFAARFETGMRDLRSALDAAPFGDPAHIEKAADRLAAWADDFARRLNNRYLTRAPARRLFARIPELYGRDLLDYNSARQVGWASEVLFKEAYDLKGKGDKTTRANLAAIDKELRLRLPKGRGKDKWIENDREAILRAISSYDPETFRARLGQLAGSKQ
jgi:hypothetical protein